MLPSQPLCLSSSEFPARVQTCLKDVYRSELFTDLTLVTEDLRESRAHRLVVSSGSKVLQKILASKSLERDPVIFLSGILHDDLTFILQFLYYGDVTVPQDRVKSILAAANSLKVHQLCGTEARQDVSVSQKSPVRERPHSSTKQSSHYKAAASLDITPTTIPFKSQAKSSKNNEGNYEAQNTQDTALFEDVDVNGYMETENYDVEFDGSHGHLDIKEEKPFMPRQLVRRCKDCDVVFADKPQFFDHMVSVHDKTIHQCDRCDHSTLHRSDLRKHIESVHERKKFPCTNCNYVASSASNLRVHQMRHEGIKFPCKFCDLELASRNSWRKHVNNVHGDEILQESD